MEAQIDEAHEEKRHIEEAKFNIGVPENGQAVPTNEIPYEYNVDRAIVLTINPRFVFASGRS